MFKEEALNIIRKAITEEGILASAQQRDNYARVWARDSMMAGFAGILINDEEILAGLEKSILTLAKHQAENGQIPSNVFNDKASYGTHVGRTDATTWWIVVTCEYIIRYNKTELKKDLEEKISKALSCLKTWEYNQRGFLYSPLGGNWADEYVTSGYTLYDNVLRYWAVKNAAGLYQNEELENQATNIKKLIQDNFYKTESDSLKYHETAYSKTEFKPYFWASLNANGYDVRFDLAGNALAILLDFELDFKAFSEFLEELYTEFGHWMLPVFYPVIYPGDYDWKLLENNYSYSFKNEPHHFHNGGSWPIFLGWLCLALNRKGLAEIPGKILSQYEQLMQEKGFHFREYYSTDKLLPLGTEQLCFSASGYLMMTLEK
ncbi:glycoside hydrolase 100 family protein [Epilithonimonas pallida]|uniref:beta-fructofuranosidase n=1 Tax=Epilithonimonas pallida TaxID=373671 RepID=A0ABY1R614_9FLAO|nr:glycoside hydrolase 100 family protein [Epilithonimonas pallida]SMP96868.1 Alkaline and neutral invertase [Epilithonimonas pallida]